MALEIDLRGGNRCIIPASGSLVCAASGLATVKINDAVASGYVTVTALTAGFKNNLTRVDVLPAGVSDVLGIRLRGEHYIGVTLGSNASGVPTSTAKQTSDAINAAIAAASGALTDYPSVVAAYELTGSGLMTAASGNVLLAGGAETVVLSEFDEFDVVAFDDVNVKLIPVLEDDFEDDLVLTTDVLTVAIGTVLTAMGGTPAE